MDGYRLRNQTAVIKKNPVARNPLRYFFGIFRYSRKSDTGTYYARVVLGIPEYRIPVFKVPENFRYCFGIP